MNATKALEGRQRYSSNFFFKLILNEFFFVVSSHTHQLPGTKAIERSGAVKMV